MIKGRLSGCHTPVTIDAPVTGKDKWEIELRGRF